MIKTSSQVQITFVILKISRYLYYVQIIFIFYSSLFSYFQKKNPICSSLLELYVGFTFVTTKRFCYDILNTLRREPQFWSFCIKRNSWVFFATVFPNRYFQVKFRSTHRWTNSVICFMIKRNGSIWFVTCK